MSFADDLNHFIVALLLTVLVHVVASVENEVTATHQEKYKLEGKVSVPFTADQEWIATTRILVDGGQYIGFLKSDGSFTVNGVPSGSYVVEVASASYAFQPVRVEINHKGKIRSRRLNNVHIADMHMLAYPLRFKARALANYFQQREQWRITDLLMNPMVLMMVLPFLMIMVLPKLMNASDPETQREMQNQMKMLTPKQNMPDMSEMFTSLLGGGSSTKKPGTKTKMTKRR